MGRCGNDVLMKKVSVEKLSNSTEVEFRIRKDLPDCKKIDTKNTVSGTGAYNRYAKPANRFECLRKGCVNSGTLTVAAADSNVLYRAPYDATEWAAGVVTFYVKTNAANTVTVTIGDEQTLANSDVYTVNIAASDITDDGYAPVFVDLSKPPSSENGSGWTPSANGAYIQLSSNTANTGFSSISIFDTIEDFELLDVVKVSCLSSIGGTYDLEMVEAVCQDSQLNDEISSLTFPLTGREVTSNYWKLNPMMGKGSNTTGFEMVNVEKEIPSNGIVTLPDVNQDVCGYIGVQLTDGCDAEMLSLLSVPGVVDVDEGHFLAVKSGSSTNIHFNTSHSGKNVIISYPRAVEIEEMVANPDNLNGVHTGMVVTKKLTDGTKIVEVFENVYVTSFPATITGEQTEFAFTITILRDSDGNFFRVQKIVG